MLQAENLAGEYIFSPITDTRTTSLTPKIHFLAFPRDLIISIVVTLRKEGKEKKKKKAPTGARLIFSCQQKNTVPHQSPTNLSGSVELFSSFFPLPLKSEHFSVHPILSSQHGSGEVWESTPSRHHGCFMCRRGYTQLLQPLDHSVLLKGCGNGHVKLILP